MALSLSARPGCIEKTPSGITGFDQITGGGLPKGRATLVCGGPGSGKTVFAAEFLVRGAALGEPGVFIAFEESVADLTLNVASLGFDLDRLQEQKLLAVDFVQLDPTEIEETGGYSLDGLFVRLELALSAVGAKRVAIDTLEVLFNTLKDAAIVRAETHRLFRFLKERGVTAVVTAEAGESALTRQGLEEYVSDCVVALGQRVLDQAATRYLRIVKYRGSSHGTNEYPFLIDDTGFSVLPATSLQLDYQVTAERVSSGIPSLDGMLGGSGFFRTSTVLVSGTAGAGKSILSAHIADATCRRGERCMMFVFEESRSQIVRNMSSVGLDLERWQTEGLLEIRATRPTLYGLEMHLVAIHKAISKFKPQTVILDPVSSFLSSGSSQQVKAMLIRLFDWLKMQQITGFVTYLTSAEHRESADAHLSSLIDTWIEVRHLENAGERNRTLQLLKSRGMNHSNQVRELVIASNGVSLADVCYGPDGVVLGSAKAGEARRQAREEREVEQEAASSARLLELKRDTLEAQIAALRAEFVAEEDETKRKLRMAREGNQARRADQDRLSRMRTDAGNADGEGQEASS